MAGTKTPEDEAHPFDRKQVQTVALKAQTMYCCKCGARNPDGGSYCHKCGATLYRADPTSEVGERTQPAQSTSSQLDEEQRQLLEELLPIDQKADQCHACGRAENLHVWDFGLAKKVSERRLWGETVGSVVASAVMIPLLGVGGLRLPGKKVNLRVLRLRLVLCSACRQQHIALGKGGHIDVAAYGLHPWWATARRLGYTQFLQASDLNRLRPTK